MKAEYSTVTGKGQITIPNAIRQQLAIQAGNKLEFIAQGDYFIVVPITKSLKGLKGILNRPTRALSIEQINEVIKDSHAGN